MTIRSPDGSVVKVSVKNNTDLHVCGFMCTPLALVAGVLVVVVVVVVFVALSKILVVVVVVVVIVVVVVAMR